MLTGIVLAFNWLSVTRSSFGAPMNWIDTIGPNAVFWLGIIQVAVVLFLFLLVARRTRGSNMAPLINLFTLQTCLFVVSDLFNLGLFRSLLLIAMQVTAVGFIILFQPELRRLLIFLGEQDLLSTNTITPAYESPQDAHYVIHELVEATRLLSKSKTGALIVLEGSSNSGSSAYLEAGTPINARMSTELLLTIFHTNTPLHDGAVVINRKLKIAAAGVLLPLSENSKLSWQFGTRHRAAIGLTEVSDSHCIVVSEESGKVSMAYKGQLKKVDSIDDLRLQLESLMGQPQDDDKTLTSILEPPAIAEFKISHLIWPWGKSVEKPQDDFLAADTAPSTPASTPAQTGSETPTP